MQLMLKKILVMFVLLTAIFSPAELRASDYDPYADPVPIPKTEEKKSAPKQPEQKKESTARKKPSPKKPTPKKRVSNPAKNENKTVKAKTNTPAKKNAESDSQAEKLRPNVTAEYAKAEYQRKFREEYQRKAQEEREERQRKAQEEKKKKLKEEFEQARLILTDWDFDNMRVKLRDNQTGKLYNLELKYNPINGDFSFKTKRKNDMTADKMKTIIASAEVIDEELLLDKNVYFIIPSGWELRDYPKAQTLIFLVYDFNTGDSVSGETKQGYKAYQSGFLVECWNLKYLPYYFSLHRASQ